MFALLRLSYFSFTKRLIISSHELMKNDNFPILLQSKSTVIFDTKCLTILVFEFNTARINGVLLKYFYRSIPLKKMYLYEMSFKKSI